MYEYLCRIIDCIQVIVVRNCPLKFPMPGGVMWLFRNIIATETFETSIPGYALRI